MALLYKKIVLFLCFSLINFDVLPQEKPKAFLRSFFQGGYEKNATAAISTAAGLIGATYFVLKKWLWTPRNPKPCLKRLNVTTLQTTEHGKTTKIEHYNGFAPWLKDKHHIFLFVPGYTSGLNSSSGKSFNDSHQKFRSKKTAKESRLDKLYGALDSNWNLGPRTAHRFMQGNIIPSNPLIIPWQKIINSSDEIARPGYILRKKIFDQTQELLQTQGDSLSENNKKLLEKTIQENTLVQYPACVTYNPNDARASLNFGQKLDQEDFHFILDQICTVNNHADIFLVGLSRGSLILLNSLANGKNKANIKRIKGAIILEPANPDIDKIYPTLFGAPRTLGLFPNYKRNASSILNTHYFPSIPLFLGYIDRDPALPNMRDLMDKIDSSGCKLTIYESWINSAHGTLLKDKKFGNYLHLFYKRLGLN